MQVYIKSMLYEFDPTIVRNNFRTLYLAGFCHFYTKKKSCEPESPGHRHQAKGHIWYRWIRLLLELGSKLLGLPAVIRAVYTSLNQKSIQKMRKTCQGALEVTRTPPQPPFCYVQYVGHISIQILGKMVLVQRTLTWLSTMQHLIKFVFLSRSHDLIYHDRGGDQRINWGSSLFHGHEISFNNIYYEAALHNSNLFTECENWEKQEKTICMGKIGQMKMKLTNALDACNKNEDCACVSCKKNGNKKWVNVINHAPWFDNVDNNAAISINSNRLYCRQMHAGGYLATSAVLYTISLAFSIDRI